MRDSVDFELLDDQLLIPGWCNARFGIPIEVFAGHRFWHRPGMRPIWVADADCQPSSNSKPHTIGMLATRRMPPRAKPTSIFLQRFGARASTNVYTLTDDEAVRFLRREIIEVDPVDDCRGFCVVRTVEYVLGCGRIDGRNLHSQAPRSWFGEVPVSDD